MSTRGETIAGVMLLRLVKLVEARQGDANGLLGRCGLTRQELEQPAVRVPYGISDRLIELAAGELGATALGLELALTRIDESYGAAGLLLLTGATFRQGLARSLAYQRLWGDGERFALSAAGPHWAVSFRHPGPSAVAAGVTAECALVEVLEGVRVLVEREATPLSVDFAHAPFGPHQELSDHFGVAPRYQQPANRIVLAADLVDRPMHALRDLLGGALERQAARALSLLPERRSVSSRVRPLVSSEQGLTRSLEDVASALRMSPRTLQRRLQREGTSFQELIDARRRELAVELQRLGIPAKEAAFRLGFQDPSAFSRARRRWRK
jgi:AraC-like DNA-binding protein